jgi:hypothetical protein
MRFAPIFILLLGMTPGCSSEDPPAAPAPGPAPVISSVSASVVQPGDVLTIAGANFDAVPERNRVVFNNELAKAIPDAVTQDTIVVTVPDYAVSGGMRVITSGQSSGSVTMEVQRTVGDVWVAGGSNIFSFKLPAPSGSEEYLMVPYSAAVGSPAEHPYTIAPDTTSVYPLRAAPARKRAPLPVRFDAMRRRAVERVSGEAGAGRDVRGLREGPMRDFLVLGAPMKAATSPTLPAM